MDDIVIKRKKIMSYMIMVLVGLFTLVIGATYAYFVTNTTNSFGTKTITGQADATGSVALIGTNASLYLNLDRTLMAQSANDITYWAVTTNTTPSTTENVVTVASTSVTGAGYYNCNYTLNVAASGTNNMYTAFQGMSGKSTEQIVLNVGGNTYDFNTANLFPITVSGTLNGVTSSSVQNITAEFYLKNKSSVNQRALVGTDLTLTITATSFTCTQLEDPNNYLDKTRFRNEFFSHPGSNSTTIVFMNTTNVPIDTTGCLEHDVVDVSEKQNGSIMLSVDTNDCYYDDVTIYVGQNGGVLAPPDSSGLFTSVPNINFNNLDTSHVTNMTDMFYGIQNWSNIEYLDTSNVTSMFDAFGAFGDCNDGNQTLNLSGWDTSHVTNMGSMFMDACVKSVDLSTFDTSRVTYMALMFFTSRIQTIYVSNRFVTTAVVDKGVSNGGDDTMFTGSYNIVGGNGTTYNNDYTDSTYARIDVPGTPGYFTLAS